MRRLLKWSSPKISGGAVIIKNREFPFTLSTTQCIIKTNTNASLNYKEKNSYDKQRKNAKRNGIFL